MSPDEVGGYEVKTVCNGTTTTESTTGLQFEVTGAEYNACSFFVRVFDVDNVSSEWVEAVEKATTLSAPSFIGIE